MKAFGMDEATMFISYSVTDGFAQVRFPLILATTVTMTSEKRSPPKKTIRNTKEYNRHISLIQTCGCTQMTC